MRGRVQNLRELRKDFGWRGDLLGEEMSISSEEEMSILGGSLGFRVIKVEGLGLEVKNLERIVAIGCWSESDEVEVEGFRI